MTKSLIAAAAAASSIVAAPSAHADASWQIVLNGQDITPPASVVGNLQCDKDGGNITIHFSNSVSYIAVIDNRGQVTKVDISYGKDYLFQAGQAGQGVNETTPNTPLGGDAQASRSANTYRITGHVVPFDDATKRAAGPAVPFSYDATCMGLLSD
jgi:Mycobacterium 19 kDa lipoprotein antigen